MSFIIALDAAGNVVGQGVNDGQFLPPCPVGGEIKIVDELPSAYLLSVAKEAQLSAVYASCGRAIVAGFISDALGSPHLYPSKAEDQTNLIGAAIASSQTDLPVDWVVPFSCADESGTWDKRLHSPSQIQKVLSDGVTKRVAYSAKLASLCAQINAIENPSKISDIREIIWS